MSEKDKPLTLPDLRKGLAEFYEKLIEPRFERLEKRIEQVDQKVDVLKNEMNQRFDDLYKKFETLEQEYIIIKHQMKERDVTFDDIQALKKKVEDLSEKIQAIERKVMGH